MSVKRQLLLGMGQDNVRSELATQFAQTGEFEVDPCASGTDVLKATKDNRFDLIVLDEDLSDLDAHSASQQMRENGVSVPILLLTTNAAPIDSPPKKLGSVHAVSDSLKKPFRFVELRARLHAMMRAFEHSEEAGLAIGPYRLKPAQKTLSRNGDFPIHLTDKELRILKALHRADGQPVARETLLHEVWGYRAGVTTHTLETHIYRLRQKIEPDKDTATLLLTEPGAYRLNLDEE